MHGYELYRLIKNDEKARETIEHLGQSSYSFEYHHRNGLGEDLNNGKVITLSDGSSLKMVVDRLFKFVADYDGEPASYDPEWGYGSGAEGKRVLAEHTDKDGTKTYFKISMYYDSWDNGYSDEWVVSNVSDVEWLGD